ncbi:hypothetical protein [Oceanobacillus damuensis]|uniref:hypothetical protein n=1 Tax=Oceanobacillus damuensis TaxID=937928 RepID=UPI0008349EBF|nr:hypothetical protein [Oceanobacillus damuensis]
MLPINLRRMRNEKIVQLKKGNNAYAETEELIRLMKRSIEKERLHVELLETDAGCWFIPMPETKSS